METIRLHEQGALVGRRTTSKRVRQQIERAVDTGTEVELDFDRVQSVGGTFLDEILGTLIARYDVSVLRSVIFANCSEGIKEAIIRALKEIIPRGIVPRFR